MAIRVSFSDRLSPACCETSLRSFLTMAGIAWGVASIVIIVAMGEGFRLGQYKNMKQLGENIVLVFSGRTEMQAGGQRAGRRIRIDYEDIRDIRRECWLVKHVVGEQQSGVRATAPNNSGSFQANGVEPLYSQIRTIPIAQGPVPERGRREGLAPRLRAGPTNVRKQFVRRAPRGAWRARWASRACPST